MKPTLIILLLLVSHIAKSTGQRGDKLIIDVDTTAILTEPLFQYLEQDTTLYDKHPTLKYGCSTALWRGYIAFWEIKNDSLFLNDVLICGIKEKSIFNLLFPNRTKPIPATWFTGELNIPQGKMIKYFHMGYDRVHEETLVMSVSEGMIKERNHYVNGVREEDNGLSQNPSYVQHLVMSGINWNGLPKYNKKIKLNALFRINKEGFIEEIKIVNWTDNEIPDIYNTRIKEAIDKLGKFQQFYWDGEIFEPFLSMYIRFSRKNKKKYSN